MATALTDQQLYNRLVRAGVMPAVAERIVNDAAEADQQLPTPDDTEADAQVTDGDIETAAQWWLYTPDVPRKFKRLLHAKATR